MDHTLRFTYRLFSPLGNSTAERLNSKRHIRLFTMLPNYGLLRASPGSQRVRILVKQFSIDKAPEYHALSYAWGDPRDQVEIVCNDEGLLVPRNLQVALAGIRDYNPKVPSISTSSATTMSDFYWADSICINQSDDVEKAGQIRMMPEIYGQANRVVVWLGSSADQEATLRGLDHLRALEVVERTVHEGYVVKETLGPVGHTGQGLVGTICHEFTHESFGVAINITRDRKADRTRKQAATGRPCDRVTWQDLNDAGLPRPEYAVLDQLLGSAWFDRAWINQEIALAYTASLFIGPYSVTLDRLQRAVSVIRDIERDLTIFAGSNIEKLMRIVSMWERRRRQVSVSLLDAASMCRGCDATNPSDKIYSVLSLVTTTEGFPIDYSEPWPSVYAEFARSAIQQTGSLEILSYCDWLPQQHKDLPSWAPDWTHRNFARYPLARDFRAGGRSPIQIAFPDRHILRLSAIQFDRVDTISVPCPAMSSHETTGTEQTAFLIDAERMFWQASVGAVYQKKVSAFLRTLICGRSIQSFPTLHDLSNGCQEHAPAFCWYNIRSQRLLGMCSLNMEIDGGVAEKIAFAWERMVLQTCSTARLFTTRRGYIGLGPLSTRPGHDIVIPLGSECPFVVQNVNGGKCRLLGDSYIDGLMDGEALQLGGQMENVSII